MNSPSTAAPMPASAQTLDNRKLVPLAIACIIAAMAFGWLPDVRIRLAELTDWAAVRAALPGSPALQVLAILAASFGVIMVLSLLRRLVSGASPLQILRERCYESPPLRALIALAYGMILIVLAMLVCIAGKLALMAFVSYQNHSRLDAETIVPGLCAIGGALLVNFVRTRFRDRALALGPICPPKVSVAVRKITHGIPTRMLTAVGSERFPNQIAPHWRRDLLVRFVGGLALFAITGAILWALVGEGRYPTGVGPYISRALAAFVQARDMAVGHTTLAGYILTAYLAAGMLLVIQLSNREYLFFPFYVAQFLTLGLSVGLVGCALALAHPLAAVLCLAAVCAIWGWRLWSDLRAAWRYRRQQKVYVPLSDLVERYTPFLGMLTADPAFELPYMSPDALSERITLGARNIAGASFLVTRHFARYMRLAQVHHRRCAAAFLRFLTVDRYPGVSDGWPTGLPLREVPVPVWDEQLFPIHAPEGYVNWLDPLTLPAAWNVVRLCWRCGGSGIVTETEYYSETEYYTEYINGQSAQRTRQVQKSRQVTRTCPVCAGGGRLEHHQILYTKWRRLMPASVDPFMPMPELIEDAEERTFFRARYVEDRQPVPVSYECGGFSEPLRAAMFSAADTLAAQNGQHGQQVCRLLGGRLYRSELAVCGFNMIRVRFSRLRSRLGWFFGKRPEFYFPRLPMSWSMVGTMVLSPPLLVLAWTVAAMVARAIVRSI